MSLQNIDAVKATASAFGVYGGLLGVEHGYFETLQGNVVPSSLKILASTNELPFPFGHEPAMTMIPSFLVTGIMAIVVGFTIVAWSAAFLQTKYGAAVLFLLSVLLLFVGGGFGPLSLLIAACIGAAGINRPHSWWRSHLPSDLWRALAMLWPWSLAFALLWVPAEFAAGQIFDLKNDHRQTLTNLNLLISYPMLAFFVLSLITSFARDTKLSGPNISDDWRRGVAAVPEGAIVINTEQGRAALWISLPIAILLTISSLGGLFLPLTYSEETRLHAAQYLGNDVGNILLVVPILLIVAFMALRGSPAARLMWMGTLVYLVYDFLGYALATRFNSMFLAYCAVLGLSFFAFTASLLVLPIPEIAHRYGPRTPRKTTAALLLLMGLGMVFHWLSEILPALFAGRVPQAVRDSGLLTEPVAVLDLAFGAPTCLLVAVLLLRCKPLGIVLGPVLLTFLFLSSLVLAPMGFAMARHGFASGYALSWIGVGIATCSALPLVLSLRGGKSASEG